MTDRDGWMHAYAAESEIAKQIEPIDVDDDEYHAWDADGNEVSVQVRNGTVVAAPCEQTAIDQLPQLLSAMEQYAALAGREWPSEVDRTREDAAVQIWKALEA